MTQRAHHRKDYHDHHSNTPDPREAAWLSRTAREDQTDECHRMRDLMEDKCRGAMDDALYRQRMRRGWFKGEPHVKTQ